MTRTVDDKRADFRALHQQGCFVLPNPWDIGSARMLQHLGFAALASTSARYAWTMGHADNAVTRDAVLAHLSSLCAAVDLPVNADFESGFATTPEAVATNVGLAIGTGVAGLSIEDRDIAAPDRLYDMALAVERIVAARASIAASGQNVILVARTEGLMRDPAAVGPAIDRLVTFAAAGADCLYAPGLWGKDNIAAVVRAVAPKPVNVLISRPGVSTSEMADLGVRRISIGGSLARVGWGAMLAAAEQIKAGSFEGLAGAMPHGQLNGIFEGFDRG
ncbi:MAG TPA: isocitrate lyase/phosphoenolpyruvate mutase family protein [Devosia sp.]|nr:isocitrate lyase/phosphoenolpyruvate mutase family protein [Devosia sp.]